MISDNDLLFIEPKTPASSAPVIDSLTRRMTAAYRFAKPGAHYMGWHDCICGAMSSTCDYFLPNGDKINSLCVHYLAYHREAVRCKQLARVAELAFGEAEPSPGELAGGRCRDNEPGDLIGRARLGCFAEAGLDLASIYFAARDTPQRREVTNALYHLQECPREGIVGLVGALRETHGDVGSWTGRAFGPHEWRDAWVSPLLVLLGDADPKVRLWACTCLGTLASTQSSFVPSQSGFVEAPGLSEQSVRTVRQALRDLAAQERDRSVRLGALRVLDGMGEKAHRSNRH